MKEAANCGSYLSGNKQHQGSDNQNNKSR